MLFATLNGLDEPVTSLLFKENVWKFSIWFSGEKTLVFQLKLSFLVVDCGVIARIGDFYCFWGFWVFQNDKIGL